MLTLIGTGLWSIKDISVRGLEAVQSADKVYLEGYTSVLNEPLHEIQSFLQKEIILLSREDVEQRIEPILEEAKDKNIVLLIVGDVFAATTHTDLFLRAKQMDVNISVLHSSSILTAIGQTGLELYKFGKTTSMVFFEKDWQPENVYDTINMNQQMGLHTLVLLDIKTAEPAKEDILADKKNALPPRFMTVNECIEQLFVLEEKRKGQVFLGDTLCLGCARLGSDDFKILYGKASDLKERDFGRPMHVLIVPGNLHFVEEEALELWR